MVNIDFFTQGFDGSVAYLHRIGSSRRITEPLFLHLVAIFQGILRAIPAYVSISAYKENFHSITNINFLLLYPKLQQAFWQQIG
jgi:hypothetical protein